MKRLDRYQQGQRTGAAGKAARVRTARQLGRNRPKLSPKFLLREALEPVVLGVQDQAGDLALRKVGRLRFAVEQPLDGNCFFHAVADGLRIASARGAAMSEVWRARLGDDDLYVAFRAAAMAVLEQILEAEPGQDDQPVTSALLADFLAENEEREAAIAELAAPASFSPEATGLMNIEAAPLQWLLSALPDESKAAFCGQEFGIPVVDGADAEARELELPQPFDSVDAYRVALAANGTFVGSAGIHATAVALQCRISLYWPGRADPVDNFGPDDGPQVDVLLDGQHYETLVTDALRVI